MLVMLGRSFDDLIDYTESHPCSAPAPRACRETKVDELFSTGAETRQRLKHLLATVSGDQWVIPRQFTILSYRKIEGSCARDPR